MLMKIYNNHFHDGHVYLSIEDQEADGIRPSQFEKLLAEYRKPIQVMVSSNDIRTIGLLERSGFCLKRRCFEINAVESKLLLPLSDPIQMLMVTTRESQDYSECAGMMYDYYCDTHAPVNPITASEKEFRGVLPATAVYIKADGIVEAAAFIEENEIAYVCSYSKKSFSRFARSLLSYMFSRHETISFEADDTDWAATMLRDMFSSVNGESFDTYIKYG